MVEVIEKELTHIQVTVEIRDRLRDMKRGQENYDQLIRRLLEKIVNHADR